jgi:hypothetical protein
MQTTLTTAVALPDNEAPADPIAATVAALLGAYDRFMSAGAMTDEESALALRVIKASVFGAAAYEVGSDQYNSGHAMTRAFLQGLVDPAHEDLDYLRADPEAGARARAAQVAA